MKQPLVHILLLIIVSALAIGVAAPDAHNHEADFEEHNDCVVYLITTLLVLISAVVFIFTVASAVEQQTNFGVQLCRLTVNIDDTSPRAPPRIA